MYCQKCGYKIKTGTQKCPDCGTDVSTVEYCGGFWGLVNKQPPQPPVDELPKKEDHPKKTNRFSLVIVSVLLILSLVFGAIQTMRLSKVSKMYDNCISVMEYYGMEIPESD